MPIIWSVACVLSSLDMIAIALGEKPSAIISAEYAWLAWVPAIGWLLAGYRAATARVDWL